MNSEMLKPNELKLLTILLTQLEKRIYLLRVSLYGSIEKNCPGGALLTKEMLEIMENEDFEDIHKFSKEDYRLMVDCCDIETSLRRILNELTETKTCRVLKDVVKEFESESTDFEKHQKMIEIKRKQIEQFREVLPAIHEQAELTVKRLKAKNVVSVKEKMGEKVKSFDELSFLKTLMDYKVKSKKNYYEYKQAELEKSIEWYEREARTQTHADVQTVSFWLLKYDKCSEKLDRVLRDMFDSWSSKRRELEILRKYRRLNMEKIQNLKKIISEREDYIEKDRKEKEILQKKREEELKKQAAATLLQAYWRGTMVRKKLGPYKPKKAKKGKGKKEKGKKKK